MATSWVVKDTWACYYCLGLLLSLANVQARSPSLLGEADPDVSIVLAPRQPWDIQSYAPWDVLPLQGEACEDPIPLVMVEECLSKVGWHDPRML